VAAEEGIRLVVLETLVDEHLPPPFDFRGSPTVLIGSADVDPAVRAIQAEGFG
jgi:hypothetical protein